MTALLLKLAFLSFLCIFVSGSAQDREDLETKIAQHPIEATQNCMLEMAGLLTLWDSNGDASALKNETVDAVFEKAQIAYDNAGLNMESVRFLKSILALFPTSKVLDTSKLEDYVLQKMKTSDYVESFKLDLDPFREIPAGKLAKSDSKLLIFKDTDAFIQAMYDIAEKGDKYQFWSEMDHGISLLKTYTVVERVQDSALLISLLQEKAKQHISSISFLHLKSVIGWQSLVSSVKTFFRNRGLQEPDVQVIEPAVSDFFESVKQKSSQQFNYFDAMCERIAGVGFKANDKYDDLIPILSSDKVSVSNLEKVVACLQSLGSEVEIPESISNALQVRLDSIDFSDMGKSANEFHRIIFNDDSDRLNFDAFVKNLNSAIDEMSLGELSSDYNTINGLFKTLENSASIHVTWPEDCFESKYISSVSFLMSARDHYFLLKRKDDIGFMFKHKEQVREAWKNCAKNYKENSSFYESITGINQFLKSFDIEEINLKDFMPQVLNEEFNKLELGFFFKSKYDQLCKVSKFIDPDVPDFDLEILVEKLDQSQLSPDELQVTLRSFEEMGVKPKNKEKFENGLKKQAEGKTPEEIQKIGEILEKHSESFGISSALVSTITPVLAVDSSETAPSENAQNVESGSQNVESQSIESGSQSSELGAKRIGVDSRESMELQNEEMKSSKSKKNSNKASETDKKEEREKPGLFKQFGTREIVIVAVSCVLLASVAGGVIFLVLRKNKIKKLSETA